MNMEPDADDQRLIRAIGLREGISLNVIEMIGIGPFITIPLIISAMGGPQAMLGWVLGAVLAICDGLVWAELGAAMPRAGGSYFYLKRIYGENSLGRVMSFLFIWQLTFSAPLSIASGCIGLSRYAAYIFPSLDHVYATLTVNLGFDFFGETSGSVTISNAAIFAACVCLIAVWLLYRKISDVGRSSILMWAGVLLTIAWVIFAGVTHFDVKRAFDFPQNAFSLNSNFFLGLGAALLVSTYDFWGYYNIAFLGEEVEEPERNIPRAMMYSILAVGAIYLVMNTSILGVLPWRELSAAASNDSRYYIISTMMERLYGHWAGVLASVLIMWTAFASVFSLLLGY